MNGNTTINPAIAATGTGGLSGALVVLFNSILAHWNVVATHEVVAAEVTLVTACLGVLYHLLTKNGPPATEAPSPPTPTPPPSQ